MIHSMYSPPYIGLELLRLPTQIPVPDLAFWLYFNKEFEGFLQRFYHIMHIVHYSTTLLKMQYSLRKQLITLHE